MLPNTNLDVLMDAAKNPHTDLAGLRAILNNSNSTPEHIRQIAMRANADAALLRDIAGIDLLRDPAHSDIAIRILAELARNPNTNLDVLHAVVDHPIFTAAPSYCIQAVINNPLADAPLIVKALDRGHNLTTDPLSSIGYSAKDLDVLKAVINHHNADDLCFGIILEDNQFVQEHPDAATALREDIQHRHDGATARPAWQQAHTEAPADPANRP
ncbi:MAG: hypothetical protein ACD_21C00284G0013 [uncultured bacterium]|nr:MAG: hypothetical protein ACD_21C00284G0013 [uncultured bacterium]